MRRRRIKAVHVTVSQNFYNLLEKNRSQAEKSSYNFSRGRGRYKNKLSFPIFTELISKDLIFPKLKRSKI